MGAVRMCARSVLRRRVWGTIAVVLLVGVAGGAALAAAAGARRTESAYPRLLESSAASDVVVGTLGFGRVPAAEIAKLPHVERVGDTVAFGLAARPKHGGEPGDLSAFAGADPTGVVGQELDRLHMVEGRLPQPDRADEMVVNEIFAKQTGLGVGDTFPALVFSFDEVMAAEQRLQAEGRAPTQQDIDAVYTPVDLKVVGIGNPRGDLLVNENQSQSGSFLSPAFAEKYADKISYEAAFVKLRDPARDLASFEAAARKRFPDLNLDFQSTAAASATFAEVVKPYRDSLRFFAVVVALTGLLVVVQALVRVVSVDSSDGPTVAALGGTRTQRTLVSTARAAVAVVAGATVAAVTAYLASPLFPLGLARRAEPAPGLRLDGMALALGFVLIVVALMVPVAFVGWRITGQISDRALKAHPSRVAERMARAALPTSAVTGVRFAVQRDQSARSNSLATTLFGLIAAILTITAALVFATNLDRLVTTPARFGWNWEALIDTYDAGASPEFASRLTADRDLVDLTEGSRATLVVDDREVTAFGFRRVRGSALPVVTEGRLPRGGDEIALGAKTLRDLGRSVGDHVVVSTPEGEAVRMRVVGRTMLPALSLNGSVGIGEGAAITARAMRIVDPAVEPSFFLADLRRGVERKTINARYGDTASARGPQRPADILSYAAVRATPLVLAAVLALLGVGVLAHLLITSIRARRHDLAILKTLGLGRRQVGAVVAWQATTIAAIALALGIPVGLIAGRWLWQGFADSLGVDESLAVPVAALALLAAAGVVLANAIAAVPARTAARTRAAVVLRSE